MTYTLVVLVLYLTVPWLIVIALHNLALKAATCLYNVALDTIAKWRR